MQHALEVDEVAADPVVRLQPGALMGGEPRRKESKLMVPTGEALADAGCQETIDMVAKSFSNNTLKFLSRASCSVELPSVVSQ